MKVFLGSLLFFLPVVVLGAGFSSQALFLSKSPVIEGETVLIHAVVSNDTSSSFEGEVRIEVGSTTVGSVPVVLSAGEARTVSVSWTPMAGKHIVSAQLRAKDGVVAASEKATFTVAEKPKPRLEEPAEEPAEVDSSQSIQESVANLSPTLAEYSKPVFDTADSLRARGAALLDDEIARTKTRLTDGSVLGEKDERSWGKTVWTLFQTFYLYLLTLLRYLLAHAAFFYPVVGIAFLYLLWRLYRRMSAR